MSSNPYVTLDESTYEVPPRGKEDSSMHPRYTDVAQTATVPELHDSAVARDQHAKHIQPYRIVSMRKAKKKRHSQREQRNPVKHSVFLALLQIACGVTCAIVAGHFLKAHAPGFYIAHAAFPIAAGVLQIVSRCKKMIGMIGLSLVMTLITSIYIAATFGMAVTSVVPESFHKRYSWFYEFPFSSDYVKTGILLVVSGLELIFAIWASVVGCQYCCRYRKSYDEEDDSEEDGMQTITLKVQIQPEMLQYAVNSNKIRTVPKIVLQSSPSNGVDLNYAQQPPSYA